jgi:hypothetical protein
LEHFLAQAVQIKATQSVLEVLGSIIKPAKKIRDKEIKLSLSV